MEHVGTWRAGVNASPRGECTITVSEDAVLAVRHRNHSAPTTSLTSDPAFDPAGPVDSCGPPRGRSGAGALRLLLLFGQTEVRETLT